MNCLLLLLLSLLRVMQQIQSESEPLEKFIILNALQSTNEALFYHVVIKNLKELAPVIYTPTVGEACQKYDRIFRYTYQLLVFAHKSLCKLGHRCSWQGRVMRDL